MKLLHSIRSLRLFVLVAACSAVGFLGAAPAPAPALVSVQPQLRHQTLQGFGASIVGWVPKMQAQFKDPAFADYAANELGMSVFRLQMWGGVMPDEVKDWHDISYRNFVWDGGGSLRGKVNADWAKLMVQANPEVKIIGSVWSAPGWMKVNGKRTGTKAGYILNPDRDYDSDNRLREDRYEHFAKWVVEFARYMEAQGTPFYALSLQNELMFTEPYESCIYTPEEYARLVRVTGEMFEREGVRKPLFFGPEDMTLATYADEERHRPYVDALMQPDVAKYFDVFATHGYSDGILEDSRQNVVDYWQAIARFGRPYWITEGGSGEIDWPAPVVGGIASRLHVALAQGNVSLFTGWQLTGAAGKNATHSFMTDGKPTKKTFATMQFWRHLRPGTVRVNVAEPAADNLLVSAYVHDERGESITILINTDPEPREVLLNWGRAVSGHWQAWQTSATQDHAVIAVEPVQQMVRVKLPGHSITTTVADWDRTRVEPLVNPGWEREIKLIEHREAEHPVPANGILFVGSSSIRMWSSLAEDFPGQPVYNRGFGGSQISDLVGYFDRVIAAGAPRQIIIYSGTNDISGGESPEHVMGDFMRLCDMIAEALPDTQIAFIGAAPNPRRWTDRAAYLRFNAMAEHYCQREGFTYIDVWTRMIGEDGLPSRDIYRDDQLHMNAAGYAIWREIMTPLLTSTPSL